MLLLLEITGLVALVTFLFVSIWGFILMNQIFGQIRYRNYLMEKLTQYVYMLKNKDEVKVENKDNIT
jgi:hypothetical protein